MPDSFESILSFTRDLAEDAGKLLIEMRQQGHLEVKFKSRCNLVTNADLAAEALIKQRIQSSFPAHSILAEESTNAKDQSIFQNEHLWIIDPLDGTTNFSHGHLHVAVSIAYAIGGKVQCAVVHCPFLKETFSAIRGRGAFLNSERIETGKCRELKNALVGTGFPAERSGGEQELALRVLQVLLHCRCLRRIGAGSIDICWVACGRLDAFYETLAPWDIAAACLIAEEAGATIQRLKPSPFAASIPDNLDGFELLVSNPGISKEIKRILSLEAPPEFQARSNRA